MKAWQDLDNPLSKSALHSIWMPGILLTFQLIKYFGALDCNCTTIFRTWLGPVLAGQPYQWGYYSGHPVVDAPYSVFWYLFWGPIGQLGNIPSNLFAIMFDTLFLAVVWKYNGFKFTLFYQSVSLYILLAVPTDMLIVWLLFLSFQQPFLLVLAPMFKLPFGAPLWVWQWILFSPYSIHSGENILRYSVIGAVWLFSVYTSLINYDLFGFKRWNPVNWIRAVVERLSHSALRRYHATSPRTILQFTIARESETSNTILSDGRNNDNSPIEPGNDFISTVLREHEPGPSHQD